MILIKNKYSIKNISQLLGQEDEKLLFGEFLDSFYSAKSNKEKTSLIEEEPFFNKQFILFLCILASTAEKLAKDNSLLVPEWTNNPKYILNNKYFAFNTKNPEFQNFLFNTTPEEYKKRNLIIGNTILERC